VKAGAFWATAAPAAVRLIGTLGPLMERDLVKPSGKSKMKTYLLLVTWIVSGQPPNSYQASFNSAEACEAARLAVLMEAQRLKTEFDQRIISNAPNQTMAQLGLMGSHPPSATAVCAAQ
jgi:hypothetical protein